MAVPTGNTPLRRRGGLRAEHTQLLLALVGLGLGLVLPRITAGPEVAGPQVNDMLLGLGFGVLSVTTVIFSVLFLVVQWAHTTFTPRLTMFRDSRVVWRTFAFAISLSVFSFTSALTIGTDAHVTIVVPAVGGALLLVLLVLLWALLLRAFASIQLGPVLHFVTGRGRSILHSLYANGSERSPGEPESAAALPPLRTTVTWPGPLTVLQQVDMERLLEVARRADAVVVLRPVPGAALPSGGAVADAHGGDPGASAVLDTLVTGAERTFDQDPLLAFRLLADIVLRALSPAVNDSATAVEGLDCLEDLLAVPAPVSPGPLRVPDRAGTVRVLVHLPGWERFLHTAVDDVIAAAVGSPMTLKRLRTLLLRLRARGPADRDELLGRRLEWVEAELAQRFPVLWDELGRTSQEGRAN
ncbi:DUF2254 family protein [Streptomyces sp. NPDC055749]